MRKSNFHGLTPAQLKEILGGSSLDELTQACGTACYPGCKESCKGGMKEAPPGLQPSCPGSSKSIPMLCASATLKFASIPMEPAE